MKKKTLFIFLLVLLPTLGFSQITIDSFKVYSRSHNNTYAIDSVYISGTAMGGQSLDRINTVPTLGPCGLFMISYIFEGCQGPTPATFDTMLVVPHYSSHILLYTVWDTTASCTFPTAPTTTDTAEWFNCFSTNTTNISFTETIHLYPNPAQHTVQLELPVEIQIQRLSLSDVSGRVLRQYGPQQRSLEVAGLPPGLYFLRIESDRGAVVRRLLVE